MPIELDRFEAVFYVKWNHYEFERDSGIRAMNLVEAERIAWQNFDYRHSLEKFTNRSKYNVSIRRIG